MPGGEGGIDSLRSGLRPQPIAAPSPVAFAPYVELRSSSLIPAAPDRLLGFAQWRIRLRSASYAAHRKEGFDYEHFWNDCGQVFRDLLSVFNFSKSPRISATFFARDHFLICRSRLMVAVVSIGPSVYTKVKSFSCFACREPLPSACRRMRFETFLVCPTYSIPLRINKI